MGDSLVWSKTELDLLMTKVRCACLLASALLASMATFPQPAQAHGENGAVVQRYIPRPMLLDGYKFGDWRPPLSQQISTMKCTAC